jgi:predicted RNA-binding Zn ribbon-like protein
MAQRNSCNKYSQFRFDAGGIALNFVATVRHRGSRPKDLLSGPDALPQWFRLAGLLKSPVGLSSGELEYACLLREAIHRTIRSVLSEEKPNADDIALINMAARYSIAVPQLNADTLSLVWEASNPVNACLSVIARDAIMLIGDDNKQRLKICDCDSCQMLFADASPSNRRRWCSMSICGNRQKVALHRQRKCLSA